MAMQTGVNLQSVLLLAAMGLAPLMYAGEAVDLPPLPPQPQMNAALRREDLKSDIRLRFEKITAEIGQMRKIDQPLKVEYLALRTDVNAIMEREVTEAELNKLSDRAKILQLHVLAARAKEAEEDTKSTKEP